ncbi:MAG: complex I 24 kDa subunit family protein [Lachnospirales bacterium]
MKPEIDYLAIDKIIEENESSAVNIIAIMQDIQNLYKYLDRDVFEYLSKKLNVSKAHIYSVATFYENFSLEPKGKYLIKICDGTACHVRKSIPILNRIKKDLSLDEKEHTTKDLLFTVETVSCLGACGLAPALVVNEKVYPAMTPEKATELIIELKEGENNDN